MIQRKFDSRIEAIFSEIIELPVAERSRRLRERCGADDELFRELERLIASDSRATNLDRGALLAASELEAGATPVPGETLGPYRLIELLGEGGMGAVYRAEQESPIRRQVAVKVIKPGLDSRLVIARFQYEREALALMDHSGIARILDAGQTDAGRPYFVMELVDGQPITRFCDSQQLSVRERLELFVEVCGAIHHAHQKGVIHRDLKPSNILIANLEGKPHPKVIDFGVARALNPTGEALTWFAGPFVWLGTPEYMSPEAARGGADLDTRCDIYSLGVLLYELLTGRLPYERERWLNADLAERTQIILAGSIERPSDRTTTARASALRGDLDWIVLRALESERERRYPSASELAADIRRHLACEPVLAGPPSRLYRLRKLVRRHHTEAIAITIVVLGLILSGSLSAYWYRARNEEILRMADGVRLADAIAAADKLWPPDPSMAPKIEEWLVQHGRPLAARLPLHEETLARVRARARPYTDERRQRDRSEHPRAAELMELKKNLDRQVADVAKFAAEQAPVALIEYTNRTIVTLRANIAEAESAVEERWTWEFDDPRTRWEHEHLQNLVEQLRRLTHTDVFVGAIASVEDRLEFARSIQTRSVTSDEARARWDEARADIRTSPHYGGLELSPVVGLLPLGRDARSGLWEFWHLRSGECPQPQTVAGEPSPWTIDENIGLVMVLIPGGEFLMGAQKDDPNGANYDAQAFPDESPVHTVRVAPFFLSKYEMSQAQWRRLAGTKPSTYGTWSTTKNHLDDLLRGAAHPVDSVSPRACERTLARAGLRLPTEEEWEYAARARSVTVWPWGGSPIDLAGRANVADRFGLENGGDPSWAYDLELDDSHLFRAICGRFEPNVFGLHDVIGNVWEICSAPYVKYEEKANIKAGVHGVGETGFNVLRGGSWDYSAAGCRSARRYRLGELYHLSNTGVRPALELPTTD
ncbi:MAG: protein kinase domain-containing protein [Planctomycetota bacterium]